jgi:genome maintenance exonuclease 1
MFKHLKYQGANGKLLSDNLFYYDDLKSVTSDSGSRKYVTPHGKEYPSITTILSILSKGSIEAWKKRVGHEKAERISKRACDRGTQVHELIEKYLDNNDTYSRGYFPHILESLQNLRPELAKLGVIYEQECALYSDHLGVAGRVDCVAEYDGELSIIDFKTSSKLKKKEWIESYFLQCTAYSIMWEEQTGIPITKLVVMIAVDGNSPQTFIEHRDNWTDKLKETIKLYGLEQS